MTVGYINGTSNENYFRYYVFGIQSILNFEIQYNEYEGSIGEKIEIAKHTVQQFSRG